MDALEFVRERNRMCKSFGGKCDNCPADRNTCCNTFEWQEELVAVVEKWSAEHPRKTRQSEFLKQWPNAKCVGNILTICPKVIDMSFPCSAYSNADIGCPNCRRKFWMQEIE